jgi:hypothetical protein
MGKDEETEMFSLLEVQFSERLCRHGQWVNGIRASDSVDNVENLRL